MVSIDGQQLNVAIADFSNLEEILVHVKDNNFLQGRAVTEIKINGVFFSEIYPHQAEDIASKTINSIEIMSISIEHMILDIVVEMDKIAKLIKKGSREVARLCREGEDDIALELLQDLLDVIRDFRKMQETLEISLSGVDMSISTNDMKLNELLSEMNDVLSNEDWILLADLFEYEFIPFCDKWKEEVDALRLTLASKLID